MVRLWYATGNSLANSSFKKVLESTMCPQCQVFQLNPFYSLKHCQGHIHNKIRMYIKQLEKGEYK